MVRLFRVMASHSVRTPRGHVPLPFLFLWRGRWRNGACHVPLLVDVFLWEKPLLPDQNDR